MEYPYNLTKEEAIRRIREVHHSEYDPTLEHFDVYDQLLACEAVSESISSYNAQTTSSVIVSGNDNDTRKHSVNPELHKRKLEVITELKRCGYRTPPTKIAALLEELFIDYSSKKGHWLYIAQHWAPRAINRTINQMIKQHHTGFVSIKNPAAYFTSSIKYRKKRKFTGINGGSKQQ